MANEAQQLLNQGLGNLQRNALFRKGLALMLLIGLLGIAGHFLYEFLPRSYALKITGGDLLSNRHYLAKSLQSDVAKKGVSLQVIPMHGSREALDAVDQGKLDLAFVQGGLDPAYANVTHVATVAPELLHFLVQPGINEVTDLRGKRINLGSPNGGTRVIAKQVLDFSGLTEGIDYVESNLSSEQLIALPRQRLPEAIVITSFVPSDIAEFLVKERGYEVLEIPFPRTLALRLGWVANGQITAYMYGVKPPVPKRDIQAVGVNLHLVAHKDVDPRAIFKVLESLFSPSMEQKLRMKLDESRLTLPSGYPLSEGSQLFLDRKNPLISSANLSRIQALFGLLLSIVSTVLVVYRWFLGPPIDPPPQSDDDGEFIAMMSETMRIEIEFDSLVSGGALTTASLDLLQVNLARIKSNAINLIAHCRLSNPKLPAHLLTLLSDLRQRMESYRHAQSST